MKAPYPWFGGKSTIMPEVWRRLGDTYNFVDPFFGSNAPLLSRLEWNWSLSAWHDSKNRLETINDKDCYVANFQRALKHEPAEVARWADDPINEADLHARHLWLIQQENFIERMKTDPDYHDTKVAGWWVWGLCQWIGTGWCKRPDKSLLMLRGSQGIHTLSTARKRPYLGRASGIHSYKTDIYTYFDLLSARLRKVRVCCGDWKRVMGPMPTYKNGLTAIILDPPYSHDVRDTRIYNHESPDISIDVRNWALENGDNPLLRIALFGYEDEHAEHMPPEWECLAWKALGGMGNHANKRREKKYDNNTKERIWFSPHCLKVNDYEQLSLYTSSE